MFVRCLYALNVCLDEYELFPQPRVAGHYSHCVGIEKVSSLFVWSSLCATNRLQATEVYEQCKVC